MPDLSSPVFISYIQEKHGCLPPRAQKPRSLTISQNLQTAPSSMMTSDEITAAVIKDCYAAPSRLPRLAIQAHDAGEDAGYEKAPNSSSSASIDGEDDEAPEPRAAASLPETPERWRQLGRPLWVSPKDYDSETETRSADEPRRRRRWGAREINLERSWQMRRCRSGGEGCECKVVVRPQVNCGRRISMDMEEVRACRDLGLDIPLDFTVEIPGGLSGNGSSCNSPIGDGEDPGEIKTKLRMWAQAVAFVSAASRRGS